MREERDSNLSVGMTVNIISEYQLLCNFGTVHYHPSFVNPLFI